MKPLAEAALKNQETDDRVDFVPPRFEHTFTQWMENVHDWVISRQLWWGHQIPAWYHKETGEIYVGEEAPEDIENWEQDSDVFLISSVISQLIHWLQVMILFSSGYPE